MAPPPSSVKLYHLMLPGTDTIAAIATARGQAALAIVRVSGSQACSLAARCFRGSGLAQVASHTAHVGYVVHEGQTLDQVVATVFRAPRSSTGEDVVEFTCHGGDLAPHLVLEALVAAGARPAEPGEFTQRAFLNGKMDLAQAEAIADLIHASSTRAHEVSVSQLRGAYSERLAALREELLTVTALIELELDFSEEDVAFAARDEVMALLEKARTVLAELQASYRFGRLVRDGVRVVIAGRPNAGKSTLLNRLVGYDRAIVSPLPGTTRDHVEAEAEIGGLRFVFTDTAGLRETADAVEAEGVSRAHVLLSQAEQVVYVYDAGVGFTPEESQYVEMLRASRPDVPIVVVANKCDLVHPPVASDHLQVVAMRPEPHELDALIAALLRATEMSAHPEGSPVVTNARHRAHLGRAAQAVERAREALEANLSGEVLAADLKLALHELGCITGAITNEQVLDQIFSRFCIGK